MKPNCNSQGWLALSNPRSRALNLSTHLYYKLKESRSHLSCNRHLITRSRYKFTIRTALFNCSPLAYNTHPNIFYLFVPSPFSFHPHIPLSFPCPHFFLPIPILGFSFIPPFLFLFPPFLSPSTLPLLLPLSPLISLIMSLSLLPLSSFLSSCCLQSLYVCAVSLPIFWTVSWTPLCTRPNFTCASFLAT